LAGYPNLHRLDAGAFAEVWACRGDDGEICAKKVLVAKDPDSVARFRGEVRLLASLRHRNIVRVLAHQLERTPCWYAMPLYQCSLRTELPMLAGDEARIRPVFVAILCAVGHAHGEGVLHRDLKPENVLMNSDDDLVVTDFGLGRFEGEPRLTFAGTGMGSPFYVAPEQFRDALQADARADVFSLGRMLNEMHLGGPTTRGALPKDVAAIVERCTREDPKGRYATVEELKEDFLAAAARDPGSEADQVRLQRTAVASGGGRIPRGSSSCSRARRTAVSCTRP